MSIQTVVVQGRRRHPTGTTGTAGRASKRGRRKGQGIGIEKAMTTAREGEGVEGRGCGRTTDATGEETVTTNECLRGAGTAQGRRTTETGTETEAGEPRRNTETTSDLHHLVRQRQACILIASRETECTSGAVAMGAAASIWKGVLRFLSFQADLC